ncbi:hypothetical protein EON65_12865 [archaeon]|nr:MAG: hypothetical protein EON65_12865 [archaeon]
MNRSNNKARSFVIAHHSAMNVPPKRPPKPRAPTKTAFQEEMYETIEVSLCPVGTGLQTSQKASRSMNPFELAAVNPFESSKFDDDEGDDTMTQQVIAKNPFIEDDIQPAVPASKPSSILEALKNSARKNRVRFAQLGSKRGYNPFDQEEQNVYSNSGPDSSTPSLAMSQESSSSQQQQQQRNSMQDSLSTTPPAGSPSKFHHVKRSSPEKKSDPARRERDRVQTEQDRQKFRNRLLRIEQSVDNYSDSSVHCISEDKENAVIRFLLSKRVFGYPGSTGSMWSNYKHFVYNNHPFLSICCLHSKHTYNCRERIVVFFNVLCFAIFLSFILLGTTLIKEVAMCRFGCNVQDVPPVNSTYVGSNAIALGIAPASSGATNETVCMGGYNDGLSYGKLPTSFFFNFISFIILFWCCRYISLWLPVLSPCLAVLCIRPRAYSLFIPATISGYMRLPTGTQNLPGT